MILFLFLTTARPSTAYFVHGFTGSMAALSSRIKNGYTAPPMKNHGSMTPGTDGKTITELATLSDEQLISSVQHKLDWYVPQSVRRVEIPKGNDPTKKRPLGIPTIMDRLIQQCVLQVMEPICEAKFHDHSYGFRPNRNQQHAIAQVHKDMQRSNLHYVVDIDIKGFFDNVNHGKLLKQLWTMGIHDKKLLCILSAMLKADNFFQFCPPQCGKLMAFTHASIRIDCFLIRELCRYFFPLTGKPPI